MTPNRFETVMPCFATREAAEKCLSSMKERGWTVVAPEIRTQADTGGARYWYFELKRPYGHGTRGNPLG